MKTCNEKHYAIRYRNNDSLHRKGDIQHISQNALHIGQTPECTLKLPQHPHFADTCYAVIVRDANAERWRIIRQERDARILVDGIPLEYVAELHDNNSIVFDNTSVLFTVENGEMPQTTYIEHSNQKPLWGIIAVFTVALIAIMFHLVKDDKNIFEAYADEISDIYKIEADTLLVTTTRGDTLDIIALPRAETGTGFITENGYFVTARHCVEFWLGYEDELKSSYQEIGSKPVKWAIEAEMCDTIRLLVKLTITDNNGKRYLCSSEQFTMNKERDNVYEMGNFSKYYLWRSIISRYESCEAELGDVAVMKWEHGKGKIRLASPDRIVEAPHDINLQSFGYPQSQSKKQAVLTPDNDNMYDYPKDQESPFTCGSAFDKGFSGGPVFISDKGFENKAVVGIVSRLAGTQTLIVPVSQIHNLIKDIEENGQQ